MHQQRAPKGHCPNTGRRTLPWNVGGKDPNEKVSNSTESILYFRICSAIMGFAISFAVLHIAYEYIRLLTFSNLKNLKKITLVFIKIPCQDKATCTRWTC